MCPLFRVLSQSLPFAVATFVNSPYQISASRITGKAQRFVSVVISDTRGCSSAQQGTNHLRHRYTCVFQCAYKILVHFLSSLESRASCYVQRNRSLDVLAIYQRRKMTWDQTGLYSKMDGCDEWIGSVHFFHCIAPTSGSPDAAAKCIGRFPRSPTASRSASRSRSAETHFAFPL